MSELTLTDIGLPGGYDLAAFFDIDPTVKPRETRKDRWNPRPSVQKFRAFRDHMRLLSNTKGLDGINYPKAGTWLIFLVPMPKSWNDRKKRDHNLTGKASTPDVDNLCKGFLDALFYKQPIDDRTVWDTRITKLWSYSPGILLAVQDVQREQLRAALDQYSQQPE